MSALYVCSALYVDSVFCSALYAKRPYYVVLYIQNVLYLVLYMHIRKRKSPGTRRAASASCASRHAVPGCPLPAPRPPFTAPPVLRASAEATLAGLGLGAAAALAAAADFQPD